MSFQWTSKNQAQNGVEDMTLLSKVSDDQITDNLKKRIQADLMFTYIGPTLVAVNPYKKLGYFTEKEIEIYHGSASYEHPPHVYAVADKMFQSMITDEENQCVIISGESGAGKTESAKLIMNYIAAVSGKGGANNSIVDEVKRIILGSNPLLESFGNAKTLRNNNSSRFGKYFEINFGKSGAPGGGKISNFLLEKSRVVGPGVGERNFHIFYQLTKGASAADKEQLGMMDPKYFHYLNVSKEFDADGINDVEEYADMKNAIDVCQISDADKTSIMQIVAGILHLGNVAFVEEGNNAKIADPATLAFPAYLFGVSEQELELKLTRLKALVMHFQSRLFDWIVQAVNTAMANLAAGLRETAHLSLGVLDIFGFEIFERNGFEQFCINYVNERLQQIFIELTLKSEQEEYQREGIKWTPIDYFNNKVVVDLIESKRPPGIMAVLDDVCSTMHAVVEGADTTFVQKLDSACSQNKVVALKGAGRSYVYSTEIVFSITKVIKRSSSSHYAGAVTYNCDGFTEANKDTLFKDLVYLMQSTTNPFIQNLFSEEIDESDRKRPTTVSHKIKGQSQELVETLMASTPSYVRCIKPNETKKAKDWDAKRVEHQVRYLNLKENIRVRRAGYAYRNTFDKFLRRFAILTSETFPTWSGRTEDGIKHIMQSVHMEPSEWQLGTTKLFIKSPESLFLLEEQRDRKYHQYAKVIQRAYRRWKSRKYFLDLRKKAADVMYNKKERKRFSVNREFLGDYVNYLDNAILKSLLGKQEKVVFADKVTKYDRKFKPTQREFLLSETSLVFIGAEKEKSGPNKGRLVKVVKQKLALGDIQSVSLSTKADDFIVLHIPTTFDLVLENIFKTEFITVLSEKYLNATGRALNINFTDNVKYSVKKTTWQSGGLHDIRFVTDAACKVPLVRNNGKTTEIRVAEGLPMSSRPGAANSQTGFARPVASSSTRGNAAATSGGSRMQYGAPASNQGAAAAGRFGTPQATPSPFAGKKRPPPPPPKKQGPQCRALYDYEATEADELSFSAGDVINITNKDDEGWWKGEFRGKEGLFPANYTELC
ncbi:Unconventional myosin-Ie [Thoreauomyces humboldtii]|nr:Unconventional myosin-Ie [Thoreauomyces humboldtii]